MASPWEESDYRRLFERFLLHGPRPTPTEAAGLGRALGRSGGAIEAQWNDALTFCEGRRSEASEALTAYIRRHGLCAGLTDTPGGSRRHRATVQAREPVVVPWRGRQVRIRHDDPQLTIYSPHGSRLRAAIELASDVEGLRLVLASTVADRHRVRVADDGSIVGLWRR